MLLPSPLGCPHSVAFSLRNTAFIAGGILAPECKPAFTKAIPASSWSEPQQPAQTPATSQELLEPRGMGHRKQQRTPSATQGPSSRVSSGSTPCPYFCISVSLWAAKSLQGCQAGTAGHTFKHTTHQMENLPFSFKAVQSLLRYC